MTELGINRLYFGGTPLWILVLCFQVFISLICILGMFFHSIRGLFSLSSGYAGLTAFEVQKISQQFGASPRVCFNIFAVFFRYALRYARFLDPYFWTAPQAVKIIIHGISFLLLQV